MFKMEQIPLDFCPVVKGKKQITSYELREFLKDKRIKLDCGHYASPGVNLSNTLIVISFGGFKTLCHS